MEELLYNMLTASHTIVLIFAIIFSLISLSKGADILVDEAVSLSVHWNVPKIVIGATIISLGTTLPEVSVSVLAAIKGNPDLALGNAIGSIIVDTGLILGLCALIGNLHVDKTTIDKQGKIQVMAAIFLAIISLPIFSNNNTGKIHQWMGWILLLLLIIYIFTSIKWAKNTNTVNRDDIFTEEKSPIIIQLFKLLIGITIVIISSRILIPSVEITATRVGIPQSIIAATLVAFGTSLPELITSITAVRKGHSEIALGNIIGADVLNILFVIGSAAAVTKQGLVVPANYYMLQFPTMLIILLSFRYFAKNSKTKKITKLEGLFLVIIYLIYLILNYVLI